MSRQKIELEIDGSVVEIALRYNTRARRYIMRIPQDNGPPIITMPPYGTIEEAQKFANKNKPWLRSHLAKRPKPVPFENGAIIPFKGEDHKILSVPGLRGTVDQVLETDGPVLNVYGDPQFLTRRLTDWLKSQAKSDISLAVQKFTDQIKIKPTRIKIADQNTCWGSCSQSPVKSLVGIKTSTKTLSFSWRLILMPPKILEYVAAHEVAHLLEMNHSKEFWNITYELCNHMQESREWLKYYGKKFYSYG